MNQKEKEVWASVQAMNRCWTENSGDQLERLKDYFHETMVAVTPVDRLRLEGKEACFAGWSRFAQTTAIHFWKESNPLVRLYGRTAVVTYYYDMAYDFEGQKIATTGRDMMVLVQENGRWQMVADQFSPPPDFT